MKASWPTSRSTATRRTPEATPRQGAETTEVTTYTCGHRVPGPSLATADAEVLDVERRQSEDTVDPEPAP